VGCGLDWRSDFQPQTTRCTILGLMIDRSFADCSPYFDSCHDTSEVVAQSCGYFIPHPAPRSAVSVDAKLVEIPYNKRFQEPSASPPDERELAVSLQSHTTKHRPSFSESLADRPSWVCNTYVSCFAQSGAGITQLAVGFWDSEPGLRSR
jgi:hypothetical protein